MLTLWHLIVNTDKKYKYRISIILVFRKLNCPIFPIIQEVILLYQKVWI
jgi:hypothetical protein